MNNKTIKAKKKKKKEGVFGCQVDKQMCDG
jgi:hypothetical protein